MTYHCTGSYHGTRVYVRTYSSTMVLPYVLIMLCHVQYTSVLEYLCPCCTWVLVFQVVFVRTRVRTLPKGFRLRYGHRWYDMIPLVPFWYHFIGMAILWYFNTKGTYHTIPWYGTCVPIRKLWHNILSTYVYSYHGTRVRTNITLSHYLKNNCTS